MDYGESRHGRVGAGTGQVRARWGILTRHGMEQNAGIPNACGIDDPLSHKVRASRGPSVPFVSKCEAPPLPLLRARLHTMRGSRENATACDLLGNGI
jgi:hypothetical protein